MTALTNLDAFQGWITLPQPAPHIAAPTRPQIGQGYRAMYHRGEHCGGSNWHVGRIMAECAFCQTALPICGESEPA